MNKQIDAINKSIGTVINHAKHITVTIKPISTEAMPAKIMSSLSKYLDCANA